MDLSLLKTLNYKASLTDYMGGGKAGHFKDVSANLLAIAAKAKAGLIEADAASTINVSLSDEAKALLGNGKNNENITGVQKAGQNFLLSFFDQSDLDIENLSEDVLGLIKGLQDVISASPATGRDLTTDSAEEKYAGGNKKVYTMAGNGSRLRIAIDYTNGKPQKLTITDITGGQVETAEITLSDKDMNVSRTQREYVNGHMTALAELDPISVKLYA